MKHAPGKLLNEYKYISFQLNNCQNLEAIIKKSLRKKKVCTLQKYDWDELTEHPQECLWSYIL